VLLGFNALLQEGRFMETQIRPAGLRDPEDVAASRHQGANAVRHRVS
jgi:hypothetical protein